MTLDSIRHPVPEDTFTSRYEHREADARGDVWGVWDWERRCWRREPNYTRQEAATMSVFLNHQDCPGGVGRRDDLAATR